MQKYLRWLLAGLMILAGLNHFRMPALYIAMISEWLPAPSALNIISGVAEILGGVGLLAPWPAVRRAASWGLIALLLAVFPANLNMAIHNLPLGDNHLSALDAVGSFAVTGNFYRLGLVVHGGSVADPRCKRCTSLTAASQASDI